MFQQQARQEYLVKSGSLSSATRLGSTSLEPIFTLRTAEEIPHRPERNPSESRRYEARKKKRSPSRPLRAGAISRVRLLSYDFRRSSQNSRSGSRHEWLVSGFRSFVLQDPIPGCGERRNSHPDPNADVDRVCGLVTGQELPARQTPCLESETPMMPTYRQWRDPAIAATKKPTQTPREPGRQTTLFFLSRIVPFFVVCFAAISSVFGRSD